MSTTHPRPRMTIPIWSAVSVGASVIAASAAFGWVSAKCTGQQRKQPQTRPDSKREHTDTPAAARQLRRTRQHQRPGEKGQTSASFDAFAALESMWERRSARAVQHPRCELTPCKPLSVWGRNLGEDPVSMFGACGSALKARRRAGSRRAERGRNKCEHRRVPLLTCLPGATRISTGCTDATASRRSLNALG